MGQPERALLGLPVRQYLNVIERLIWRWLAEQVALGLATSQTADRIRNRLQEAMNPNPVSAEDLFPGYREALAATGGVVPDWFEAKHAFDGPMVMI